MRAMCFRSRPSGSRLLFAFPETDRIKDDATIRTSLKRKPWPECVLFVDDRDSVVFISLAVTIDANGDLTLPVLDDQVDPFAELHA